MNFSIECEEEIDGRWIAEVPQLPGVLCYGNTADEAMARAEILALRAMAERLEHNESRPVASNISLPLAAGVNGLPSKPSGCLRHCLALGGKSSGSLVLTARCPAKGGLMLSSRFTTAKKSAPECLRALPGTPASLQKICSETSPFPFAIESKSNLTK